MTIQECNTFILLLLLGILIKISHGSETSGVSDALYENDERRLKEIIDILQHWDGRLWSEYEKYKKEISEIQHRVQQWKSHKTHTLAENTASITPTETQTYLEDLIPASKNLDETRQNEPTVEIPSTTTSKSSTWSTNPSNGNIEDDFEELESQMKSQNINNLIIISSVVILSMLLFTAVVLNITLFSNYYKFKPLPKDKSDETNSNKDLKVSQLVDAETASTSHKSDTVLD